MHAFVCRASISLPVSRQYIRFLDVARRKMSITMAMTVTMTMTMAMAMAMRGFGALCVKLSVSSFSFNAGSNHGWRSPSHHMHRLPPAHSPFPAAWPVGILENRNNKRFSSVGSRLIGLFLWTTVWQSAYIMYHHAFLTLEGKLGSLTQPPFCFFLRLPPDQLQVRGGIDHVLNFPRLIDGRFALTAWRLGELAVNLAYHSACFRRRS